MEEVQRYKEMTCSDDGDRVCPLVKWPAMAVKGKSSLDLKNNFCKAFNIVDISSFFPKDHQNVCSATPLPLILCIYLHALEKR